jgi:hypothetical protein
VLNQSLLRIDIFRYSLDQEVKNNLSEYVLSTISNMLALYYASDEKLQKIQKDIQKYAEEIAAKLHRYLKEEVVLDETFDVAMNLFAIAISPEIPDKEAPPNLSQQKNAIIDVAINMCFGDNDISDADRKNISEVLSEVLDSPNSDELLALISSKPEIVRSLIRRKTKAKDIVSNLTNIANMAGKASTISTDFIQFSGLIMCGLIGFVANFAAVNSMEAIAAVTVVPTSVIALKYGTKLGELIGKKLSSHEKNFKEATSKFIEIIEQFTPDIKSLGLEKFQTKEQAHSQNLDVNNLKIDSVIKDVASHLATKEDIKKSKAIEIVHQKAKNLGRDAF